MTITLHVVSAVCPEEFYDKRTRISAVPPLKFTCSACSFSGSLKEGIAHTVSNQFTVREPSKKREA
jgi:hypothetical protein